jgi:hypothetical protein
MEWIQINGRAQQLGNRLQIAIGKNLPFPERQINQLGGIQPI